MAEIDIQVGGHRYPVACRDGEEAHLESLAALLDRKVAEATQAVGALSESRLLLFAGLLLADELNDARRTAAEPATDAGAIEALAARIEALAARLEADAVPS